MAPKLKIVQTSYVKATISSPQKGRKIIGPAGKHGAAASPKGKAASLHQDAKRRLSKQGASAKQRGAIGKAHRTMPGRHHGPVGGKLGLVGKRHGPMQTKGNASDVSHRRGRHGGSVRKHDKLGMKAKDRKRYRARYRGWLKTAADWARFDAWAKINAQPKKYPEPLPMCRKKKPLGLLMRRICDLSVPKSRPDCSLHCRLDFSISRAALKAEPSRRTIKLAMPPLKCVDYGRPLPTRICDETLQYKPTQRILALSEPKIHEREECKITIPEADGEESAAVRKRLLALKKKQEECPEGMTKEEWDELFTPRGVRKTALEYEATDWTQVLAIPPYKLLRHRSDKLAKSWKKQLLSEAQVRGKRALRQQRKRRQRERERMRREMLKKRGITEEGKGAGDGKGSEDDEDKKEGKEKEEKRWKKRKKEEEEEKEIDAEEKKKAEERRKKAKNAWRYAPLPYKKDAYSTKKSALKAESSELTKSLAKPKERVDRSRRKDPFKVRKGTQSATASERISNLAKPKEPVGPPVAKKPPREKNKYGVPIIPKPKYGKRKLKAKPYKMGECKTEEQIAKEKEEEEKKKKRERQIDPIVFQPTIDPCFDPRSAKIQIRERKRAEIIIKERRKYQMEIKAKMEKKEKEEAMEKEEEEE